MVSISERENREIEAANASGNTPVVFIHGIWLLPSSWDAGGSSSAGPATRRSRRTGRTILRPSRMPAQTRTSLPRRL